MIKKIIIISKKNIYRQFGKSSRLSNNLTFKKFQKTQALHERSLAHIKGILKKYNLNFQVKRQKEWSGLEKADLIITVGGDGTLLRASHHINDQFVIAINSVPGVSVGALLEGTIDNFESTLKKFLNRKISIRNHFRLQVKINGKVKPVQALNDVLFANASPAGTARYVLKKGNMSEEQKSSGLWVATSSGSTGAILAAGGKKDSGRRIQYVVREPFAGFKSHYRLIKGFSKDKITLINHTLKASLFIDGTHVIYPLQIGDKVEIELPKKPLRVIV